MSVDSLRRLLTLAHVPAPMAVPPASGGPAVAATGDKPGDANLASTSAQPGATNDKAGASQKYFKQVSQMLDDMRPGPSLKDNAGYLMSDARRIDQMPILNVDPQLVDWGSYIASTFRDCAAVYASGQQRVTSAVNGVAQPNLNYGYGSDNNTANELQASADLRNASQQRRQAAANEKSRVIDAVSKPLRDAIDSRAKIRAAMVEKYNVEF
jgi:hypothetical protein